MKNNNIIYILFILLTLFIIYLVSSKTKEGMTNVSSLFYVDQQKAIDVNKNKPISIFSMLGKAPSTGTSTSSVGTSAPSSGSPAQITTSQQQNEIYGFPEQRGYFRNISGNQGLVNSEGTPPAAGGAAAAGAAAGGAASGGAASKSTLTIDTVFNDSMQNDTKLKESLITNIVSKFNSNDVTANNVTIKTIASGSVVVTYEINWPANLEENAVNEKLTQFNQNVKNSSWELTTNSGNINAKITSAETVSVTSPTTTTTTTPSSSSTTTTTPSSSSTTTTTSSTTTTTTPSSSTTTTTTPSSSSTTTTTPSSSSTTTTTPSSSSTTTTTTSSTTTTTTTQASGMEPTRTSQVTRDPVPSPCPPDTFSSTGKGTPNTPCRPHKVCGDKEEVKTKGTDRTDVVCIDKACVVGQTFNKDTGRETCSKVKQCDDDWQEETQTPTLRRDRECKAKKCPVGSWASPPGLMKNKRSPSDPFGGCTKWTPECNSTWQEETQTPTHDRDRICKPKDCPTINGRGSFNPVDGKMKKAPTDEDQYGGCIPHKICPAGYQQEEIKSNNPIGGAPTIKSDRKCEPSPLRWGVETGNYKVYPNSDLDMFVAPKVFNDKDYLPMADDNLPSGYPDLNDLEPEEQTTYPYRSCVDALGNERTPCRRLVEWKRGPDGKGERKDSGYYFPNTADVPEKLKNTKFTTAYKNSPLFLPFNKNERFYNIYKPTAFVDGIAQPLTGKTGIDKCKEICSSFKDCGGFSTLFFGSSGGKDSQGNFITNAKTAAENNNSQPTCKFYTKRVLNPTQLKTLFDKSNPDIANNCPVDEVTKSIGTCKQYYGDIEIYGDGKKWREMSIVGLQPEEHSAIFRGGKRSAWGFFIKEYRSPDETCLNPVKMQGTTQTLCPGAE